MILSDTCIKEHTVKLNNHLGHTSNIFHLSSLDAKIWIVLLKNIVVQRLCKQSKIQTQPDHWKLVLDPKVSKIKSLDFPPIFIPWPKQKFERRFFFMFLGQKKYFFKYCSTRTKMNLKKKYHIKS